MYIWEGRLNMIGLINTQRFIILISLLLYMFENFYNEKWKCACVVPDCGALDFQKGVKLGKMLKFFPSPEQGIPRVIRGGKAGVPVNTGVLWGPVTKEISHNAEG